ncbi:helix-turn-helix transcriptional regulator [Fuerstiella marisgermanici]|uniref:Iron-sulfur cluster biosynthesis transcriptional regulator SufR n=1 Tax=Fuerstiella marisgermanici TaxID=1891926 RepID=A0A1P8WB37_9PLAN|nr:winged helix-turn-helix transcriptional regulator [Fuerstiella marisgermanici]APZ91265.1 iron-sulfur cluster biosynthesis transcriptional regulator SufR [Fuerstiella marisgermanici]
MSVTDTKDREILEHLHRSGEATVQDLCDVLDVTRNAIRQRITRLEASGVIVSDQQSQSRGRPKNVYRVTAEGLHSLGEDYRELAVVLWEAIVGLEDSAVKEQLISQVRDRLADRFRRKLTEGHSADQRLDQLAEEMRSSGFNVESDHSAALPILRETNCPFPMLADVDETICQVERQVLEQVLGAPVEFKNRCRDGHHCCEFEVQTAGK